MIVDVHCHMFNGDDLPVAGFVRNVVLHSFGSGDAKLLDRCVQGNAPNAADDIQRFRDLMNGDVQITSAQVDQAFVEASEQVEAALAEDPALAAEVRRDLAEHDAAPVEDDLQGLGLPSPDRARDFVAIMLLSCVDIPARYAATTGKGVSLAIPLLVDLDAGVHDRSITTPQDLVEVFDLQSEASMRELLPGAKDLRLHPFIGYDPLRELAWQLDPRRTGPSPVEIVQDAVLTRGFVGVKVYPPMGWRPAGNAVDDTQSIRYRGLLDEIVLHFARWCAGEQVPVTAHCNDSNYASAAAHGDAHPDYWHALLHQVEKLRLNLGHFGGIHEDERAYGWTRAIAGIMADHENVYADVSCHDLHHDSARHRHNQVLGWLSGTGHPITSQTMFGTDWFMQVLNKDATSFLETYRADWEATFDKDAVDPFLRANALRFLGFDDASNENGKRLAARYKRFGITKPDWLTASAD